MTADEHAADLLLFATLDREARTHEDAAARALRDRRKVFLRLYETHRMSYAAIEAATGYCTTTIHKELRRARGDRAKGTP